MLYLLKKEWRYALKTGLVPFALGVLLYYINASLYPKVTDAMGIDKEMASQMPVYMSWQSQKLTAFLFIGLLCISVYMFYNMKNSGVLQLTFSSKSWFWRVVLAKTSVTAACGLVITLNVIAYDIWGLLYSGGINKQVLANLAKCWVLNLVLPTVIAVLLGFCIVVSARELPHALAMIVVCVFFFGGIIGVVFSSYSMTNPWVYKIVDLFAIYPTNLEWWPDSIYGFVADNYRIAVQLLWVVLPIGITFAALKPRNSVFGRVKKAVLFTAACAVAVYIMLPNGAVRKPGELYESGACNPVKDQLALYSGKTNTLENKAENFTVTAYDLTLKPGRVLNAVAKIQVADTDKTMYFTLYYGYKVKSVQDQNGRDLTFDQRGDAFTVYGTQNTTCLTVTYNGYSNYFYSNDQAMYLSGKFAYYPTPGRSGSMVINSVSIYNQLGLNYDVPFTVTVDTPYPVYCSLPQVKKGVFRGVGRYPSLIGGLVHQTTYNGLTLTESPARYRGEFFTAQEIMQTLQQQCEYFGVTLPDDFSYNIMQEPALQYRNSYYAADHAMMQEAASPVHVAVGIMAVTFGDPDDLATKLLCEYVANEDIFSSAYLYPDAATDFEKLCNSWIHFAADNGIDFTMNYTIDYVVNQRGGGVMNYLNAALQAGGSNQ